MERDRHLQYSHTGGMQSLCRRPILLRCMHILCRVGRKGVAPGRKVKLWQSSVHVRRTTTGKNGTFYRFRVPVKPVVFFMLPPGCLNEDMPSPVYVSQSNPKTHILAKRVCNSTQSHGGPPCIVLRRSHQMISTVSFDLRTAVAARRVQQAQLCSFVQIACTGRTQLENITTAADTTTVSVHVWVPRKLGEQNID